MWGTINRGRHAEWENRLVKSNMGFKGVWIVGHSDCWEVAGAAHHGNVVAR